MATDAVFGSRARDHWDLWDTVRPKPTTALDDYTFDVTLRTKDGSLLHSGKLLPMIKVDERFISFDGRSPSAAGGRVRWVRLVSLPLPQQALPWWVRGFDYDPVDYDPGDLRATDDHAYDEEEENEFKELKEYRSGYAEAYAAQVSVRRAKTGERSLLFDDASFHLNATSGEGQRPILGKAAGPIYAGPIRRELTDDDIRSPFFADGYFSAGAEARERKLEDGSFNIAGGRDDDDYDVPHGRFVLDLKRPGGAYLDSLFTDHELLLLLELCWNTSVTSTDSAAL